MAGGKLQAPRGTFDVLPDDARRRDRLVALGAQVLEGAGYAHTETPVFEDTALFARGVGESTDIVQKEMFTFEDMGGRSLTLRPENTAGICRAYIEHGMHKLPQPVKLWSCGPFFRHEAPQAGRYRQFTQMNVEALGSDDPSLDADLIVLLAEILARSGVRARLLLSSLGNSDTRAEYGEVLRAHLRAHEAELSDEVRSRMDSNPLRAFDSDHPGTRAAMAEAPRLIDRLDAEDTTHFAEVRALLEEADCAYELDPTLVRGLDYYTRTVFEFQSDDLGAQRGVGGGGRYDGLVEKLGGPATPGIGWAAGVERILLATQPQADGADLPVRAYVVVPKAEGRPLAFRLVQALRKAGALAEMEQAGRSVKGQMKQADRIRADYVVIAGDSLEVKHMGSGEQREVASVEDAVAAVTG